MARIILGPNANIQSPPNLSAGPDEQLALIQAGINDWGGISPLTRDWVNPEAPWPHLQDLASVCRSAGRLLLPRLPVYPEYIRDPGTRSSWLDPALERHVLRLSDSQGYARAQHWAPGLTLPIPLLPQRAQPQPQPPSRDSIGGGRSSSSSSSIGGSGMCVSVGADGTLELPQSTKPLLQSPGLLPLLSEARPTVTDVLRRLSDDGEAATKDDIVCLFSARGDDLESVCRQANALRARVNGDQVTYVVNRNINYTNMCTYSCKFCAFSKGPSNNEELRGTPYLMSSAEISRRVREAWDRGATEVCMQGGIHPEFSGRSYLDILRTAKAAAPGIHVHAFSPLEVHHGATTLGCSVREFLAMLRDEGLGSLPGTAAEVLDDRVRAVLCPDKLTTQQWVEVVETAHSVGLRTTSTIMFGHVDNPHHWAEHLLQLRGLQQRTGGISEFVPLPFVHMQAPLYLRGRGARRGPTFHECVLMHAISRLVLHPLITNIQASWVKMGPDGARVLLGVGCNDMGGTLTNESITRAAGASHGQEFSKEQMEELIVSIGRQPQQRTTLYARIGSTWSHSATP